MSDSIISSFFFLHIVQNYHAYDSNIRFKTKSVIFEQAKPQIMSSFSKIYTVMETQAVGFPLFEKEIETSAAIITAFSFLFCERNTDPYLVAEIMSEADNAGELGLLSAYYLKIHQLTREILRENHKHVSKSLQRKNSRNII